MLFTAEGERAELPLVVDVMSGRVKIIFLCGEEIQWSKVIETY
jgi:hypothetical protein